MKKIGFTFLEVLVAIVILTVVASLSIATYQKTVNTNRDTLCLQNLKVLQAAIDIYTLEKDTLPTTLSQLEPRHIYLAYEKVVGKRRENPLFSALRNILGIKPALAQSLAKYYASQRNVFICPNDMGRIAPGVNDCPIDINNPFPCGSYTFNFKDGETTITESPTRPKRNSIYALIYDTTERHKQNPLSPQHANGAAPSGFAGKVSLSSHKMSDLAPFDNGTGEFDCPISPYDCDDKCGSDKQCERACDKMCED